MTSWKRDLDSLADRVYESTPGLLDIRSTHGWMRARLGDPFAGIFFIAENPSLSRVVPVEGEEDAENLQWAISPGDRVFRDALTSAGFKDGDPMAPGGWRCYLTDVIKSPDVVSEWRARSPLDHHAAAEAWAPVLRYELELGGPRLVVSVGKAADRLLDHLLRRRLIPELPNRMLVDHYAYVASRPDARQRDRGPMHPDRITEYHAQFAQVRTRLDQISGVASTNDLTDLTPASKGEGPRRTLLTEAEWRHVCVLEVPGRPATFATAHEAPWKEAVRAAIARSGLRPQPQGTFKVKIDFTMPAPRHAGERWDLDNLVKPTLDAMEGIFGLRDWKGVPQPNDDCVVALSASKRTAGPTDATGARIEVWHSG